MYGRRGKEWPKDLTSRRGVRKGPKSVLYPKWGPRRGSKSLISGWGQERVKECQDETWEGQKGFYPDEGRRQSKNVRMRHERAKKGFYPDEGRRELKNVRMRHERAKKSYIRMRAGES
jgi:hypothetical protein